MKDPSSALAAAMADPVRCRVLRAMATDEQGMSVRELAAVLGEPQRKVRYHLDYLAKKELVGVIKQVRRRGFLERYYRREIVPYISKEHAADIPEEQWWKIVTQSVRAVLADIKAAFYGRTFLRPGHVELHVPAEVDGEGWDELSCLHEDFYEALKTALERSKRRLASGEEQPISVVSVSLLFEVPGSGSPDADGDFTSPLPRASTSTAGRSLPGSA